MIFYQYPPSSPFELELSSPCLDIYRKLTLPLKI